MFGFEGMMNILSDKMAQWLSWLERRPVTAEVTGSNPVWVVSHRIHRMIDDAVRNTPMWLNWQSS